MPELTATSIIQRYQRLERIGKYVDKPDDPTELARKVALFVGEDNEDAIMTFAEDGSTRDELEYRALSILLHN
jgi:hypothetical protein